MKMITKRLLYGVFSLAMHIVASAVMFCVNTVVAISKLAFEEPTMQKVEHELQEHASLKVEKSKPTNNGVSINSVAGDFVSMLKAINSRSINSFA